MLLISYSTRDRAIATEVYEKLVGRKYHLPFLDYHPDSGIPGGSKWEAELRWQLKVARGLVVLCSRNWLESKWCFAELDRAREFGKKIIPLVLDDVVLPSTITPYQVIHFRDRNDAAYERLWRALKENELSPGDDFFWPRNNCPYPGLASFQEDHAGVFFGREQELSDFFDKHLTPIHVKGEQRLVYVIGPSGSGKSSFVRAGVIPRLKFKGLGNCQVLTLFRWADLKRDGQGWGERLASDVQRQFGEHPRGPQWNAEERIARYAANNSTESIEAAAKRFVLDVKNLIGALSWQATPLIFLDQFEELLVTADSGDERKRFLHFLSLVLAAENSPCRAIATVRSDFLPAIQQHPQLIPWNEKTRLFRLDLLKRERLFDVVRRPAELVEVKFENDALVNRIVDEAQTSDALPLLAFALERFFKTCSDADDRVLTADEYETKLGGLSKCLNSVANQVLLDDTKPGGCADSNAENALRICFVRELVRYQEGDDKEGGKFVRRTARWSDLPEAAHPLLNKMASESYRLISIDRRDDSSTTVEVTHEALFRQWDTLKGWLDQRRDLLAWRADVERRRRTEGDKWRGLSSAQLAVAARWPTIRSGELNLEELNLINAAKQRVRAIRAGIAFLFTIFALLAAAATIFAYQASQSAIKADALATKEKKARELAEQALQKANSAEVASNKILDYIENQAAKTAAVHSVLMEGFRVAIAYLEEQKSRQNNLLLNRDLAEKLIGLAWHSQQHGEVETAIKSYQRAQELLTELIDDDPNVADVLLRRAFVMNNIGWCLNMKKDHEGAMRQHERTLTERRELLEKFPDNFEANRQVSVSLANIASTYALMGDLEKAVEIEYEVIATEENRWKKFRNNRWVGLNLSNSYSNLSKALLHRRETKSALVYARRSYELAKLLYDEARSGMPSDDQLGLYNFEEKYSKRAIELATMLAELEPQNAESRDYLEIALSMLARMTKDDSENDEYRWMYSAALSGKSRWFLTAGEGEKALSVAREAVAVAFRKPWDEVEPFVAEVHADLSHQQLESVAHLAMCFAVQGRKEDAKHWMIACLRIINRNFEGVDSANSELPASFVKAIETLRAYPETGVS